MINVTGGKDGEKVSVELIGSKDEVVREAGYVIEAVAEKVFVKNNGRGFDQATKRERIECICAAYNGIFCHLRWTIICPRLQENLSG